MLLQKYHGTTRRGITTQERLPAVGSRRVKAPLGCHGAVQANEPCERPMLAPDLKAKLHEQPQKN